MLPMELNHFWQHPSNPRKNSLINEPKPFIPILVSQGAKHPTLADGRKERLERKFTIKQASEVTHPSFQPQVPSME